VLIKPIRLVSTRDQVVHSLVIKKFELSSVNGHVSGSGYPFHVTAAEHLPEPPDKGGFDVDGPEPAPEWSGDLIAAARYGSPEAIRAALLPEQVGEFDAAFDAALTSARRTLHLDELRHVLLAWRRVALLTQMDPDAHRETLSAIAEIRRTGAPRAGSMSWEELKAELGR
jgi:hypothetical protein